MLVINKKTYKLQITSYTLNPINLYMLKQLGSVFDVLSKSRFGLQ